MLDRPTWRPPTTVLPPYPETWPPNYVEVFGWRLQQLRRMRADPVLLRGAKEYYRINSASIFCNHWCTTSDPRHAGKPDKLVDMPFVLFQRQEELIHFVEGCIRDEQHGLIEKCRDAGVTWDCCVVSVKLWLFEEQSIAIGWGSRKQELVDRLGVVDSIFEKMRVVLRRLPREFLPKGFDFRQHATHMKIVNPETGATIIGEIGDGIGRGGRTTVFFHDEAAHAEHPEAIESALFSNTRVLIDLSSVNGLGNVFHRKREAGVDWSPGCVIPLGKTRVFVFDYSSHPEKTQEWFDRERQQKIDQGLLHIFKQEVERDYAGAVEGVVIPPEWVRSAIDAHVKLNLKGDGGWCAGLDVADSASGAGDTNALSLRKGVILKSLEEWGERDTGVTARRAVTACAAVGVPINLQYDAVSVGSGVKAETNRLKDEKLLPRGIRLVPWFAGAGPQDPDKRVIPNDKDSPLNCDFYENLKAQGWWQLRRRFELTYRAVQETIRPPHVEPPDFTWNESDLISLPSDLPLLWKLVKELSQPTVKHSGRLKLMIDKAPEGVPSPNLADSVVMNYWPIKVAEPLFVSDAVLQRARIKVR